MFPSTYYIFKHSTHYWSWSALYILYWQKLIPVPRRTVSADHKQGLFNRTFIFICINHQTDRTFLISQIIFDYSPHTHTYSISPHSIVISLSIHCLLKHPRLKNIQTQHGTPKDHHSRLSSSCSSFTSPPPVIMYIYD